MKTKLRITVSLIFSLIAMAEAQQLHFDSALASLEEKAENGDAHAQCALAETFDPGIPNPGGSESNDVNKAINWYQKAANQGYAVAQCNLGFIYLSDASRNYPAALKWFKKAADQEYANAQNSLGVMYANGFGVAKDCDVAAKWYRKGAENGNAVAQFNLGMAYFHGEGVKQDYREALKWYHKAADQGDAHAQGFVGLCYEQGKGVLQDYKEAVEWYRKAAQQGSVRDQCSLAFCFLFAKGVQTNYVEAAKWFRKAAEQEDGIGAEQLGECYLFGHGVTEDHGEAAKWFLKAAKEGEVISQYGLGLMYYKGDGVVKSATDAVTWFRKAAEQGSSSAQYELGRRYYFGDGVLIDYAEAVKWNALAAAQGYEDAVRMWTFVLREKVAAEQIAEGQRRAKEFVPHTEISSSQKSSDVNLRSPPATDLPKNTGTGFLITDDGYLISNYHVVKDAAKVRVLAGAGLIDAKVVKVDAANDLALLKAVGRFDPLPIAASRAVKLGGTVATVGFPDIGLQGFAPKLAKGKSRRCRERRMTRVISKSACRFSRAIQVERWWTRVAMWWGLSRPS